jgi:hypothetical protein
MSASVRPLIHLPCYCRSDSEDVSKSIKAPNPRQETKKERKKERKKKKSAEEQDRNKDQIKGVEYQKEQIIKRREGQRTYPSTRRQRYRTNVELSYA